MPNELVFAGEGQLAMAHKYDDIAIREQSSLTSADLADAVVINMQKATMNAKLGSFDTANDSHANSAAVSFSVAELVADIEAQGGAASGIAQVGALSSKLATFKQNVKDVFTAGSETIFADEAFNDLSDTFGAAEMLALMKLSGTAQDASSSLALKNVDKLLRDAVDQGQNGRSNASEVSDGFKADDKVYFVNGVKLDISVAFVDNGGQRDLSPANITNQSGMSTSHLANLVLHIK